MNSSSSNLGIMKSLGKAFLGGTNRGSGRIGNDTEEAVSGSTKIEGEGTYKWTITPLEANRGSLGGHSSYNDQRFRLKIEIPEGFRKLTLV